MPSGDGKVAFIDTRDLGELAAAILADPAPHAGHGYTLTGLRRGDAEQVDPTLAQLLGRPSRDISDYIVDHVELWQRPDDRP